MKKQLGRMIIIVGLVALSGSAIWGFVQARGEAKPDDDDKPARVMPRVSTVDGAQTITLDDNAVSRGEIEIVTLKNAMFVGTLRAYGSVLDLQSLTSLANKYATAKANLETQEAKRDLSQAALARGRGLYSQGPHAISKAQLETAEETFRIDAASLSAAKSELASLANTAVQAWGSVLGHAVCDATPLLVSLIERREVLVQVALRADEIVAKVPDNTFVRMQDGKRAVLHFVSPAASTDPQIQGRSFFYTAPADDGLLPGMNVVAFVPTGQTVARVKIPAAAIVWLQGRAWAYFRSGPKTFARREVATDAPAPDGGYFVKNVADGTRVVSRGAQMLLSEEFRAQIQEEE